MTGRCQAQVACTGARAVHMHHRKRRAQGVDNSIENLLPVCSDCHSQIHHRVAEAYELGLLVHSWDDPAEIPVRINVPKKLSPTEVGWRLGTEYKGEVA